MWPAESPDQEKLWGPLLLPAQTSKVHKKCLSSVKFLYSQVYVCLPQPFLRLYTMIKSDTTITPLSLFSHDPMLFPLSWGPEDLAAIQSYLPSSPPTQAVLRSPSPQLKASPMLEAWGQWCA
jgi:hypothetical protein